MTVTSHVTVRGDLVVHAPIIVRGVAVLSALVLAGVLLVSNRAPTAGAGTPALIGASDEWRTGPSFYRQSNCYDYGARQAWPEWRCLSDDGMWVYHYRVPTG